MNFAGLIKPSEKPISYFCGMQHAQEDLQVRWLKLRIKLKERFGIKPDMNGVLFLLAYRNWAGATGIQQRTEAGPDAYRGLYSIIGKRLL